MNTLDDGAPFADINDLRARWPALAETDDTRAATLLEDASDLIRTQCDQWRQCSTTTLRRVCCAVVKRAMLADTYDVPEGVSQTNQTTGPFSDGMTFANPTGDLYLLDSEKRSLGMKRQRFVCLDLTGDAYDGPRRL